LLIAGFLVALSIYAGASTPYLGVGYDDGRYVMLAQALARGHGLAQISIPGNPPEPQFPPGWSLLLSPIWLINPSFPENVIPFKFISITCALAFAALAYGYLRWRGEGERTAILIALLTLFNPFILGYATSAFSEMAYAAISVGALWLVERFARLEKWTWVDAIIPALVTAGALYIRTFGVALLGASFVYLILQQVRRKALLFAGLAVLLYAPWFARSLLLPSGAGYSQQFFLKSMEQPELGAITVSDLILRVILNLRAYLLAGFPGAVMPSQVPLTYVNLDEGLRVGAPFAGSDIALALLVMGGVLGQIFLRRALVDWYLAFYFGLGLVWNWEPTRFVVPLIPFLYAALFFEIKLFASPLEKRARGTRVLRALAFSAIALFLMANVVTQARYAWSTHSATTPSPDWSARLRLFDWLERNTSPDSVFAALNDSQVYLYTQRRTVRDLGSADALVRYGVEYVVLIPYGGVMVSGDLSRKNFDPLWRAHSDAFTCVYADELAGIEVLQVRREELAR